MSANRGHEVSEVLSLRAEDEINSHKTSGKHLSHLTLLFSKAIVYVVWHARCNGVWRHTCYATFSLAAPAGFLKSHTAGA